jgi:two-component system, OmpR family, response regulator
MARVLIVDDTEIVRKALELAVRKMGHETESTSDALRALEIALARPPDLAVLDYRMPLMDGVTLYTEMRLALGDRCPKVLFISATPPEEVRAKASPDLLPMRYVRKPFHLDDLSRVVREALAA